MGIRGFTGNKSLLYHLRPPTEVRRIERGCEVRMPFAEPGPVRHRLLRTAQLAGGRRCRAGPRAADGEQDVTISVARPYEPMRYWYRYAHGDEVIFVHEGTGSLESQFGTLRYGPGDYLVIPTGVIWRMLPDPGVDQRMLVVETSGGHIDPPKRYVNPYGQFLESAPYAERDIRPPEALVTHDEKGEFEVRVKARGYIARYIYPHHPLDVVGWDGHLWPFAFNIGDFEPITGRVHQPPPVHQTFDGPGFVLCSFVPRLFDYHPLSIPAPYNHSNVDSDEVIYYVQGDFMSRRGIEPASFTMHPNGIPHGPHPGTYEGSIGKARTEELAVMVDTFRPLQLTTHALGLEDEPTHSAGLLADNWRASRRHHGRKELRGVQDRRSNERFMQHPVVTDNEYTQWFAHGDMPLEHLRHFAVQFSVFSNQFLLAALNRVINADTLQAARESKEILMNELGVIYTKGGHGERRPADARRRCPTAKAIRRSCQPKGRSTAGGSAFRRRTSNGCCVSASRWVSRLTTWASGGTAARARCISATSCSRLYGSDDYNEAMGAAFAVENWAAAGFWKELIAGLEKIKATRVPDLPLAFFTWHDKIEDQHKAHVWDELSECYDSPKFREEPFISAGVTMLDGVKVFWDGLDEHEGPFRQIRGVD